MRSYPLALAQENQTVQVVNVTGGRNLLRRLLAMGISDQTELVVVRRGETRWALGMGVAHQILVKDI